MKIKAKQYALSLYELTSKKDKSVIEKIIRDFVLFLAKKNDLSKIKDIISELDVLYKTETGELKVELISARELLPETLKELKNYLEKISGANKILLTEKIDPEIIGGFVARYEDRVIDGSLKHNLLYFQKELSN